MVGCWDLWKIDCLILYTQSSCCSCNFLRRLLVLFLLLFLVSHPSHLLQDKGTRDITKNCSRRIRNIFPMPGHCSTDVESDGSLWLLNSTFGNSASTCKDYLGMVLLVLVVMMMITMYMMMVMSIRIIDDYDDVMYYNLMIMMIMSVTIIDDYDDDVSYNK